MQKNILKKVVAMFLAAIMAVWGLPLNIFAETTKSTETFASEEETVQVANYTQLNGRSTSFNSDWKFNKDNESGSQNIDFDDSSWRTLDLPHDWSIESEFTTYGEAESGFLLGGIGWYRKTFALPESYANKRISIEFGGVYMNATIYVNGTELGTHPYGYTPFAFDITDYLNFDGTNNVIAVKVNHQIPSSRWYSGSGIYRDVNLVVTDNVHVKRYGTKVTTPNLETEQGGNVTVNMSTDVKNDSSASATVTVKNTVYDNSDTAVSETVSTDSTIDGSASQKVEQTLSVNKPKLWSVDSPNMYYVKTQIVKDNKVIDEYTTDFGFRYFNFDKNTGFSLNGQKMKLKGVCMHHDQGALGAVANYSAVERQVKKLKAMGCNAIRVTHNPASDELLEICNKEGIMIVEEAFDGWARAKNGNTNDYSSHFNETISSSNKIMDGKTSMTWAEFDIKQMVNRGKNNPCIIMWSIGNEVLEGASSTSDSNYPTYAQNLIDWVKEIDTTRPTTSGDNASASAHDVSKVIADNGGVVGFNYSSSLSTTAPIYGSETSSAVRSRGVYKYNKSGASTGASSLKSGYSSSVTADHQIVSYDDCVVSWGSLASDSWNKTITNDNRAGEFVWTGFDYIGEPTPWNKQSTGASASGLGAAPKSSYFGIIDTAGFEKDIYYFYQSQWNDDVTTLHILPCWDEDSIDQDDDGNVKVVVYSDAKKVNLSFEDKNGNKTNLGTKEFTKTTTSAGYTYQKYNSSYYLTWSVPYKEGTLTATAYDENNNKITQTQGRNTVTTSGTPSKLEATVDQNALNSDGTIDADGYDLAYISVDVTDANGVMDPNASNEITFNVTGDAKIVGVDNGDATDTTPYKPTDSSGNIVASSNTATRKAFNGKALVIVQSTKKNTDGSFTLTATADGLASSSVTINTKAVSSEQQENQITEYKISKDYYVYQGVTPQLPTSVKATYSDGTTDKVNVTWNSYDKTLLQKPNVFKVSGTLEGTDINVEVNVHVVGNVVSALNYSTFTTEGVAPNLPEKVKVVLEDGTVSEEFTVTWDDIATSEYASVGIFTVNGVVTVLDKTYDVTASVRVAESSDEENIAINSSTNSDVPTLSQSIDEGNTSDNLDSINDGVTNDSSDTNARWTNYKVKDNNETVYVEMDWDKQHTISYVNLYFFTDNHSAAIPESVTFSYFDETQNGFVEVNATSTPETPQSYTAGATKYTFETPITTNELRINMLNQSGHCCGLTEAEVYSYKNIATANTEAKLSKLEVDGTYVDGFDADTMNYTVQADDNAIVSAETPDKDNAAVTVLPKFNDIIKVLVQSEDHNTINTYNITVEKVSTNVDKSQLEKAISDANKILNDDKNQKIYTESTYNVLNEATSQGQEVFNNESAKQSQVDSAVDNIKNAYELLQNRQAPSVSLTLTRSGGYLVMKAKTDPELGNYYEIKEHGILYIKKTTLGSGVLDINNSSASKITFAKFGSDGSFLYKYKPSGSKIVYSTRAYLKYEDPDGNTHYVYSKVLSGNVRGY